MLDIAFLELTGGTEEQVCAHKTWLGVNERHHILKLIAKTKSTR
jgi:hypothetical protein